MDDWLKAQSQSDVQHAIESQTIQTTVEQNTSGLTDVALQSYLSKAPIPRIYLFESVGQTCGTGVETIIAFSAASKAYDPYTMLDLTSGYIRVPIDGFYLFNIDVSWDSVVGGGVYQFWTAFKSGPSSTYGLNSYLQIDGQDSALQGFAIRHFHSLCMLKPFRAGDNVYGVVYQNSSAVATADIVAVATTSLSAAWVAPYNNYIAQGG